MNVFQDGQIPLHHRVRDFPLEPGVYLMKDAKKQVIYVGKAKNLRNRVSSYFVRDSSHLKTQKLMRRVDDVQCMVVSTEVEALLLERVLIKSHAPMFNVLLRDDKNYPYVRADLQNPWPRLTIVRVREKDGATYLGPFSCSRNLYAAMDVVHRIFPLVRCSPYEFEHCRRPCNYYEMGQCWAPCHKDVDQKSYHDLVEDALDFLSGKNSEVRQKLHKKMLQHSKLQNYTMAASCRDQLAALDHIAKEQQSAFSHLLEADVIAWVSEGSKIYMHVLQVRDYMIYTGVHFVLDNPLIESLSELISLFLLQYYEQRIPPSMIILSAMPKHQNLLQQALRQHVWNLWKKRMKIMVRMPYYKDEKNAMDISFKNAMLAFSNDRKTYHTSQNYLTEIEEALPVPLSLCRVECVDISHLQGTATVASIVVFVDGKLEKSQYRRYQIKQEDFALGDDYGAISEVISRRFQRMGSEDVMRRPKVIVIDGGKGQLSAAVAARDAVDGDWNVPLIAIAKEKNESSRKRKSRKPGVEEDVSEKLYFEGYSDVFRLIKGSSVYRLFTQLRDESHRFALSYHKQKRFQERYTSQLKKIPGVGDALSAKLLQQFVSYDALRVASIEELTCVSGISRRQAQNIVDYFSHMDFHR